MSLGNGTTVSGLGAVNNDAHNVDDKGNVQVDFVWGNVPMQPNDFRDEQPILNTASYGTNLDFTKDNHVIVETGWNGYPLYTPNTTGSEAASTISGGVYTPGAVYLQFPVIIGDVTAVGVDNLTDAGYASANITTTAGVTNTAKAVASIARTSGSAEVTITASGAFAAYLVGSRITIGASTGIPAELVGDWTVTGGSTPDTIKFQSNGTTVLSVASGALTGSASLTGKSGTIKSYTLGAGTTANQTTASTITVYAWA